MTNNPDDNDDLFSPLNLNLPQKSRRGFAGYDMAEQAFAPKIRSLVMRVIASPNGIRIKHPDYRTLNSLRHKFYQWRHKNRNEPYYDKTIEQFVLSIHKLPEGVYALDIKVFSLSDFDIEDLPPSP